MNISLISDMSCCFYLRLGRKRWALIVVQEAHQIATGGELDIARKVELRVTLIFQTVGTVDTYGDCAIRNTIKAVFSFEIDTRGLDVLAV